MSYIFAHGSGKKTGWTEAFHAAFALTSRLPRNSAVCRGVFYPLPNRYLTRSNYALLNLRAHTQISLNAQNRPWYGVDPRAV